MVTANFAEVAASLRKAKEEIDRRLENMVKKFAYHVVLVAVENTPYGDLNKYFDYYQKRITDSSWQSYGLEAQPGFAQGSWQANTSGSFAFQENYGAGAGDVAARGVMSSLVTYKLGKTVYIGNTGPYIQSLENGGSPQAPMGIMQPTVDQIINVLQADLVRFYREG